MSSPARPYTYETSGAAIYAQSFATIRAEADLSRVPSEAERTAVRMVHSCGQTDLTRDLVIHPRLVRAARGALQAGAPILVDAQMIAAGVTRSRLPASNEVLCLLDDPRVPDLARVEGTTRSAAAVTLWADRLGGSVVGIGNAPTALFRLLELLDAGAPAPAAIIGVPVGFVGAAESKDALAAHPTSVPYLVVRGRRGGSGMAVAALNAVAMEEE